jgi:glycosyltransferase involved in cell wall biosynthesis
MVNVSVVMPTYNTEISILREAVNSILNQTFRDFEFIIIDDGSTDDSVAYLQSLQDKRIRLIRNPKNMGITKSLNIGLQAAQGKYIARMDSDDIALPTRLEKQFSFMEKHPDVFIVGSNVECFGKYSATTKHHIKDMERYRISALFVNPGPKHPTAFFNRELLLQYHLFYDETLEYSQDYGLWVEISKRGKICLLDEVLLRYRVHSNQVSNTRREKQIQCDKMILEKQLRELLGDVTKEELDLHFRYGSGYYPDTKINNEILKWCHHLIEANDCRGVYNKRRFRLYVYDTVIKRTIYHSFEPDMSYFAKVSMFFRYLPFAIALKASLGMSARTAIRRLRR